LSVQSLLFAVGIGSGAALPLAAAANWVLKDGLGQVGGILYAAILNTRFDADPKRWRWVSALVLDLSSLLEMCTPFFPGLFLPIAGELCCSQCSGMNRKVALLGENHFRPPACRASAALANVGKNVAWLSASATRAGIHQSLALHGNLADVTGKGA
jgi:hypothetical protein